MHYLSFKGLYLINNFQNLFKNKKQKCTSFFAACDMWQLFLNEHALFMPFPLWNQEKIMPSKSFHMKPGKKYKVLKRILRLWNQEKK